MYVCVRLNVCVVCVSVCLNVLGGSPKHTIWFLNKLIYQVVNRPEIDRLSLLLRYKKSFNAKKFWLISPPILKHFVQLLKYGWVYGSLIICRGNL